MSVSLPSIASFHQGAHSVAVVGLGYVGLPRWPSLLPGIST